MKTEFQTIWHKLMPYEFYKNKVRTVFLNVTDQCNFRCVMCFCEWKDNYMTEEIADKGIQLALANKDPKVDKITVVFFGGEPLMNWDLVTYVCEKYQDQCLFSMTSNMSLLTEERATFLNQHNVGMLFSIDGDKETQDINRPFVNGQGTFDVISQKIPMVLRHWPQVTFRSTIIPKTADKLFHNYMFARQQGFINYFCTPDAYSDWHGYEEILTNEMVKITGQIIDDIYGGRKTIIPQVISDGLVNYFEVKGEIPKSYDSPMRCGMGSMGFGVGASGIISACQEHSTICDDDSDLFVIGDVYNGIDEERHYRLIKEYMEQRYKYGNKNCDDTCKDCRFKGVCIHEVCPSRQFFMTKRFDKIDYATCLWTKIGYLCATLIISFFERNYSENFEKYLTYLLKNNNAMLIKEEY